MKQQANDITTIETMSLMITKVNRVTATELRVRMDKLATPAYPDEAISDGGATQAQLISIYVDALWDGDIRHNFIRRAPTTMTEAVNLARESKKL